jgi:hypothetical protein
MSTFLIHIGFPKSGSCFLGEWFHRHPSFAFKDFKIAGFESTSDLCKFAVSENNQVKYFVIRDMIFSCPIIKDVGGMADIDEYQEKVCTALYSLFPDSKILIVTRGFESSIISNYIQYVKEGGIYSLKYLIETNLDNKWIPYNYSYLINIYRKYFGNENVIVLPYELLKESREDFLKYIEEKLVVPPINIDIEAINVSLPKNIVYTQRKLNRAIYYFSKFTGPPGRFIWRLYLKKLDSKKTASKNRFFLARVLSFLYNNRQEDTNIPFEIIREELLLKFQKFGTVLKEYKIFEKYYKSYYIK